MPIPPKVMIKEEIPAVIIGDKPLSAKMIQPRVISINPKTRAWAEFSMPATDRPGAIIFVIKDMIPRLFSISPSMLNKAIYAPTIRIEITELYTLSDSALS